ncbi:MAG: Gfo/Idh/MocA family protein [Bacillota bacterium]
MVRFGVLGAGKIAKKFANTMNAMGLNLYAIASRSRRKAEDYKQRFNYEVAYEGYDALLSDPLVDAVYIATPHALHHDHIMRALDAGKHVLCEKPLTVNAKEAEAVFEKAEAKGLFVMEAMKVRTLPVLLELKTLIQSGIIGDIQRIEASFGFERTHDDPKRLIQLDLGGGALLDVGIYPIALVNMVLGQPDAIESDAVFHENGVDLKERVAYLYPQARAEIAISIQDDYRKDASIDGTKGRIEIPHFSAGETALITDANGDVTRTLKKPHAINDFEHQINETIRCIEEGLVESPINSHAMTLEVLRQMDAIRKDWGLKYPGES